MTTPDAPSRNRRWTLEDVATGNMVLLDVIADDPDRLPTFAITAMHRLPALSPESLPTWTLSGIGVDGVALPWLRQALEAADLYLRSLPFLMGPEVTP